MVPHAIPTRREAKATCALSALAVFASAALMTAATLAPAPLAVLPLLVVVCIGCPLAVAWQLPLAIAVMRATEPAGESLERLRRNLARLPETEHPLGY